MVSLSTAGAQPRERQPDDFVTVRLNDRQFELVVLRCLRNAHVADGARPTDFSLEAMPAGSPESLLQTLRSRTPREIDARTVLEIKAALEAHGPMLTVVRFKGGGDIVSVSDMDDLNWISNGDAAQEPARFLNLRPDGRVVHLEATRVEGGVSMTLKGRCTTL